MSFESNNFLDRDNNYFDKKVNNSANPKNVEEKVNVKEFNANDFEKLSTSPEVKRSLEKVLYGCANKSLKKDRELLQKEDISSIYKNIIKYYPALRVDLSLKFGLDITEKKFSNLSIDQKIVLIGLYRTYIGKPNGPKGFLNKFNAINEGINYDINKDISINFDLMQLKNALSSMFGEGQEAFKKTLRDLGVHERDIPKFKEYLDMLKKHPKMVQQAGFGTGLVIGLIIGVLLAGAGVYIYNDLTKPKPNTEIYTNEGKIENIREVLKLLLVEADFTKTGKTKKEQFTIDKDGNPILNFGKEVINKLQSSEIEMEVKGVLGIKYDFSDVDTKTKITRLPNGTEYLEAHIYIKNPPEVVVMNSTTTVLKKNSERVQLNSFNQIEQETKTKIEKDQIAEAMRPGDFYDTNYPKSLSRLINTLESLFSVGINRTAKVTIHIGDKIYSHPADRTTINSPVSK